jgi:hypothetical protein
MRAHLSSIIKSPKQQIFFIWLPIVVLASTILSVVLLSDEYTFSDLEPYDHLLGRWRLESAEIDRRFEITPKWYIAYGSHVRAKIKFDGTYLTIKLGETQGRLRTFIYLPTSQHLVEVINGRKTNHVYLKEPNAPKLEDTNGNTQKDETEVYDIFYQGSKQPEPGAIKIR